MNTEARPPHPHTSGPNPGPNHEEKGRLLTALARAAIARELDDPVAPPAVAPPQADWLRAPGAVFVTLTEGGQLRGCIGSLEARRPLREDVAANARAAAFDDHRFPPLAREELARIRVEVSLLSPAQPLHFTSEADALEQLRPDLDGVILNYGYHQATFLPQVWAQLPEPGEFMAQLKRKAGLAPDFWSNEIRLSRYRVEKFREETQQEAPS